MKGATDGAGYGDDARDVSIHAPNEGSDMLQRHAEDHVIVSIHAPNEGSDFAVCGAFVFDVVSIHAPNEGSDLARGKIVPNSGSFNPRSQ